MPLESDDSQDLKPKDLVFILAIAGRIDAQSRILAQQLDKERNIYYGYAILDCLSSSYSMFKYFFDVFLPNTNSDTMHDIMMTPGGIIAISIETLFLVSFSLLAVKFENENENKYKQFIATAWPYFRDVIKGLKNAYKGWRSAVVALSLLGVVDLSYLIAPVGLALGILAAANRFWLRSMLEDRKKMMIVNEKLRKEIKKLPSMSEDESQDYLEQIQSQSWATRYTAFFCVGIGGFIDGLYLYVGVLALAVLSSYLLSVMVVICAFYTAACVITRMYEEYDFQLRLLVLQTKCTLDIIAKQTETIYAKLLSLQELTDKSGDDLYEIKILKAKIFSLLDQFDLNRKKLSEQTNRTYLSSALLGLKNGLYAYGALASILFLVGSILTLSGVVFPPALLITSVLIGLIFIATFTIHSVINHYNHLHNPKNQEARPYKQLVDMKNNMKFNFAIDDLLEKDTFRQSLEDGLAVDSSPQFFYQEWFEVIRSIFSGFSKGQKFIDFAGNPLQEADDHGHYKDTAFMYVLSLFSALVFGAILGLRALARGLGRSPLGQEQVPENEKPEPQKVSDDIEKENKTDSIPSQTTSPIDEIQPTNSRNPFKTVSETNGKDAETCRTNNRSESLPQLSSQRSLFGFFETKSKRFIKSQTLPRSGSNDSLVSYTTRSDESTILGLG